MLLVARVVFFVHHYKAQLVVRKKERRPRTNDDGRCTLTPGHAHPQIGALVLRHARVEHRDAFAETCTQSFDDLCRERDLRQQVEHLFAARDHFIDQGDVQFCFAGGGDATQKHHILFHEAVPYFRECKGLCFGEGGSGLFPSCDRRYTGHAFVGLEQAFVHELFQRGWC